MERRLDGTNKITKARRLSNWIIKKLGRSNQVNRSSKGYYEKII